MTKKSNQAAETTSDSQTAITQVFMIGYICQGIAQHFCLIAQPLNNFLKAGLHLDATRASLCISILMLPWVIKPIYGMLSDYYQFAGTGKSRWRFLILVHVLAAFAYGALAFLLLLVAEPPPRWSVVPVAALVSLAGVCIAFATVIFVAITVERSYRSESARLYFGVQAMAYSAANIVAVSVGGQLCARLSATQALAWGLGLAASALLILPLLLVQLKKQEPDGNRPDSKNGGSLAPVKAVASEIQIPIMERVSTLARDRKFYLTLLFLTLWNLSPNLGVSLYFFECDKLKFSQALIGTLAACTSTGTLIGSMIFRFGLAAYFRKRQSTYLLVILGATSTMSYVLLGSPLSGMVIEFFRGMVSMIATLAIYGLAADVSPRGLTATAMAIQIAVFNLASEGSIAIGGFLYSRVFANELLPLIAVSSITTLLTVFLVPFLGSADRTKAPSLSSVGGNG